MKLISLIFLTFSSLTLAQSKTPDFAFWGGVYGKIENKKASIYLKANKTSVTFYDILKFQKNGKQTFITACTAPVKYSLKTKKFSAQCVKGSRLDSVLYHVEFGVTAKGRGLYPTAQYSFSEMDIGGMETSTYNLQRIILKK